MIVGALFYLVSYSRFLGFYPGGQVMGRPPSRWTWMWSTVCPPSWPVLITVR